MRNSGSSGLWPFLALVAVGSTVISMMGSGEVQGVSRACCLDNADCVILNRYNCEELQGGASQAIGTNCSTVECPLLCGGSTPECNGACPQPGQTCDVALPGAGDGGGAEGVLCECLYGACCFGATGGSKQACTQNLNESMCEASYGIYQGDGTNCSACGDLCGFSAPECGGECPPDTRCGVQEPYMGSGGGAGNASVVACVCEPIRGACCTDDPATGQCSVTTQAQCEAGNNSYQGDDTNCSTVECPRDCGFALAPECNGGCPEGQTCFGTGINGQGGGAGGGDPTPLGQCECFTPPGGECVPEQDTCQPGFVCDPSSEVCCNRICDGEGESCDDTGICRVPAPAPAVSHTGLLVFLALLIGAGALGLLRLRVREQ